MSKVGTGPIQFFDITLSTPAATLANGDLLADVQELADFFTPLQQTALIQSLQVLDEDDQAGILDVLFVDNGTTLGTEDATLNISDALARGIVGHVSVVAADYIDLINSRLAQPQFNPIVVRAANTAAKSLWVAAVSRDSRTYTASGLRLRIGVLR